MARNVVVVITTGGTIAMQDKGGGAVPTLAVGSLLGEPPPDLEGWEIQVEEFSNLPSCHLTIEQLWN